MSRKPDLRAPRAALRARGRPHPGDASAIDAAAHHEQIKRGRLAAPQDMFAPAYMTLIYKTYEPGWQSDRGDAKPRPCMQRCCNCLRDGGELPVSQQWHRIVA
ncbi:MAG: hypothetical protein JWN85_2314 [Gammaproteobacteria bacterium]|nr:hypothetical protein [Gammaproteobacteria bacterium]